MKKDVYVLGIGQTVFGKHKDKLVDEMGAAAVNMALQDAGIHPKEIQLAVCGSVYSPLTTMQAVGLRMGISRIPMWNVENACASGSTAVDQIYRMISLGDCEVGLALGVESLSIFNRKFGKGLLAVEGDQQGELGLVMPGFFSTLYQLLVSERGATMDELCYPAIKNHKNSVNNPLSQYRKEITMEEIANSAMISDPLTMLHCCPQSDGAAAVILCSKEYYEAHKKDSRPAVRVASSVISVGGPEEAGFSPIELPCMVDGAKQAYDLAGITAKDLDLIELHDAFSGEELAAYEMLGICEKGECVSFARAHGADIGGICAVNPSGGLLSMGHPLGGSGVRVVNDVTRQLWGEAAGTQVPGARIGLAQMLGGVLTNFENPVVAGLHVLMRED